MPQVCIKSSKHSDNRYYLVASSRPMHALQLDAPVLFLFKRATMTAELEAEGHETDEDQDNDESVSSENECSDKALMAASKELMSALPLYGTSGRVHIPFFDNQTSYLKLIIRQEKVASKSGAWRPGKWSQEVIVESMEWKPSLFLFRYVVLKCFAQPAIFPPKQRCHIPCKAHIHHWQANSPIAIIITIIPNKNGRYIPRRLGMTKLLLQEVFRRLHTDQTLRQPVTPKCVRKSNKTVCPVAIGQAHSALI